MKVTLYRMHFTDKAFMTQMDLWVPRPMCLNWEPDTKNPNGSKRITSPPSKVEVDLPDWFYQKNKHIINTIKVEEDIDLPTCSYTKPCDWRVIKKNCSGCNYFNTGEEHKPDEEQKNFKPMDLFATLKECLNPQNLII